MLAGILHAESLLLLGSLTLHLLADLDVDIEELGNAAVEADGLALVEVTLTVVDGDTLLGAGLAQAKEGIGISAQSWNSQQGKNSDPFTSGEQLLPVEHV